VLAPWTHERCESKKRMKKIEGMRTREIKFGWIWVVRGYKMVRAGGHNRHVRESQGEGTRG
jgi:hypothetical protein